MPKSAACLKEDLEASPESLMTSRKAMYTIGDYKQGKIIPKTLSRGGDDPDINAWRPFFQPLKSSFITPDEKFTF